MAWTIAIFIGALGLILGLGFFMMMQAASLLEEASDHDSLTLPFEPSSGSSQPTRRDVIASGRLYSAK